eukprot:scaffold2111_cov267-Chaetoceros_neogracile.AAC.15
MVRQSFDAAFQSSIELEDWETVRKRLKNDIERKNRTLNIYKGEMSALHIACQRNPPTDVIKLLLEIDPDATMRRSQPYGELPLHFATGYNTASVDVIKQVVDARPSSVSVQTMLGVSALHQACIFHAPYEVIKVLVEASPAALYIEDANGRTPWDIAKVTYFLFNPKYWKLLHLLAIGRSKKVKWDKIRFPSGRQ